MPPASMDAPAGRADDLSALAWVHAELRRSLEMAHKALRRFLKDAEAASGSDIDAVDPAVLRTARTHLHQGVGALELVGLPAAADVLRAGEAVVQRLIGSPTTVNPSAVTAVEHVSFALLDYLGRQLAGKPVSPLRLFPVYSAALRLAGAERIHPADLWQVDWQWLVLPPDAGARPRVADDEARSTMETLTLALMREPGRALYARTSDLCADLGAGARSAAIAGADAAADGTPASGALRAATFWQLAAAVFEAQAAGLLASDVHTKRIASRLLAQLRTSMRGSGEVSDRLAQDLLFFCSHAAAPGEGVAAPRLSAVRQAWRLDDKPTGDYESATLGRFDPAVVAHAKRRVAAAKDAWSAVAGGELHRLAGLAEQFALVGESLQLLLPEGQRLAAALERAVAQTVAGAGAPPPALAMEVATGMLYVDATLEDGEFDHPGLAARVVRLAGRIDEVRDGADPQPLEIWMEELYRRVSDRQTLGSVVQELRASLSEVEKQIDQYFRDPARRELLIPVPAQLSAMRGVLSVLGLEQASQAVLHMCDAIDTLAQTEVDPQRAIANGTFDHVADNLGALSFLIDMLSVQPALAKSLFRFDAESGNLSAVMGQAERSSAFAALDEAAAPAAPQAVPLPSASLLQQLESLAAAAAAPEVDDNALAGGIERLAQQALAADQPQLAGVLGQAQEALLRAEGDTARQAVRRELIEAVGLRTPPPPVVAAPASGLEDDGEVRAIFIEEAREVIADARQALEQLADSPDSAPDMTGLRRAFHTLKGSARMVGLAPYGDAAWACEQLFNARLAQAPRMDPPLRLFSADALSYLDDWVEAIAAGRDAGHRPEAVARAADALRLQGQRLAIEAPRVPAVEPAAPELPAGRTEAPPPERPADLADAAPPQPAPEVVADFAFDLDFGGADDTPSAAPATPARPPAAGVGAEATVVLPSWVPVPAPGAPAPSYPVLDFDFDLDDQTPAPRPHQPVPSPLSLRVPGLPSAADLDLVGAAAAGEPAPAAAADFDLDFGALAGPHDAPPAAVAAPAAEADAPLVLRELPPTEAPPDAGPWRDVDGLAQSPAPAPAAPLPEPLVLDLDMAALEAAIAREEAPTEVLPPGAWPPLAAPASTPPTPADLAFEVFEDFSAIDQPPPAGGSEAAAEPAADTDGVTADDEPVKVIGPLRIGIPLFNIFLNEADELSRRLGTELAEWALEHDRHPVPESAVALAHSLAGSSAAVGYADLSALARALEQALMRSRRAGPGRAGEAALFVEVADDIRRLLHQFAAGFLRPVAPGLMARLDEGPAVMAEATAPPATSFVPEPVPELVAELRPEAASLPPEVAADGAALPDAGLDAVDALDEELFPIFEEEADELLSQLHRRLDEWLQRPDALDAATACLRALHTFKGGARLAGAMRLGELAHRLEARIETLTSAGDATATQIEPLLGRADAMAAAYEALRRRTPAPAHQALAPTADMPAAEPPADAAIEPAAAPAVQPPVEPPVQTAAEAAEEPRTAAASPAAAPPPATATATATVGALAIDWQRFAGAAMAAAPGDDTGAERPVAAMNVVRVRAALLDRLVNQAGEVSITRARMDGDVRQLQVWLAELSDSLDRMRRQLRDIELQAETQISSRLEAAKAAAQTFDPLEMDRYTRLQELTRFMAESVNDVATLQRSLQRTLQSTEDELAAQARLTRELQDDLLRTRMVEFESLADRLYRTVRQAARDTGKTVRLDIEGGAIEIDRGVLERMAGPFEHLLRNAVAHGIEPGGQRQQAGKEAGGRITVAVAQAGNEVAVEFADDGGGLDLARIRQRGIERGLVAPDSDLSDDALAQLIFRSGLSTADAVTELAGRGVGLDVVRAEVNALGGRIEIVTRPGQGTRFKLLLPLTTAVTQVVMLRCGDQQVAVPSNLIEVVRRVAADELEQAYVQGRLEHAGEPVPFFWLPALLNTGTRGPAGLRQQAVVVVRSAAQRVALHVDEVAGNQEVVVKHVGPQLARLPGLAGVTLLPSGTVALIYNPVALAAVYAEPARALMRGAAVAGNAAPDGAAARAPLVMVVDDSLTVRRVTQRLLVREGYRVVLAKDGLEALERLGAERPVVLLSDIEMPRMDGFDLVRNLRADPRLADLPVIMITSRIAQKHRDYATELGVQHYLGKPFSEDEMLALVAGYAAASAPDILT